MGRVYSSNWAMYTLQAGGGENTGRGWGEHRQGVGRTQAGGGENTSRGWGEHRQGVGRTQAGGGGNTSRGWGEHRQGVGRTQEYYFLGDQVSSVHTNARAQSH